MSARSAVTAAAWAPLSALALPGCGVGRDAGEDRANSAVQVEQEMTGAADDVFKRAARHGCSLLTVSHMLSNHSADSYSMCAQSQ
jgi:hypothetical protein